MQKIPSPYYRLSAKVKLHQNGKLILVKEDQKPWDLPGGGIEHHETIEEGLKRELSEELGLEQIPANLGQPKIFKMLDKTANRPLLFLVYELEIPSETKLTPVEDVEIGYFEKSALPSLNTVAYSPDYAAYIKS